MENINIVNVKCQGHETVEILRSSAYKLHKTGMSKIIWNWQKYTPGPGSINVGVLNCFYTFILCILAVTIVTNLNLHHNMVLYFMTNALH